MRAFTILTGITVAVVAIGHAVWAAEQTVVQKDKRFSMPTIQIKAGDRVVFLNDDSVTHNVYSTTKGHEFEIKTQAPGKSDSVKFDRAGIVVVECAIHPKMRLQVNVD
jgi:plastocyanin